MTISIGYPNPEDELQMMRRFRNDTPLESVISVITLDDILEAQKRVKEIFVSEPLEHYIIKLAHATRNHDYIANGVSPRATLVLVRAVQALAFYAERILHTRRYTIFSSFCLESPYRLINGRRITYDKNEMMQKILKEVDVPVEIEQA